MVDCLLEKAGKSCRKLLSNWDKMIKFNWSLPWPTHKYLIEEITEEKYLKTKLFSRFLTFIDSSRKFQQKGALLHL